MERLVGTAGAQIRGQGDDRDNRLAGLGSLAAVGLTKPADWSAADRTNDILPQLGYGAAAYATLRALDNYT